MVELLIIFSWFLLGAVFGYIIFRKRKSFIFWLIICTIFGIPGLIIALLFYDRENDKEPESIEVNPVDSKLEYLQMKSDFEKSKPEKV
jgi:hypothetical protein